jgi:hypothetical protein
VAKLAGASPCRVMAMPWNYQDDATDRARTLTRMGGSLSRDPPIRVSVLAVRRSTGLLTVVVIRAGRCRVTRLYAELQRSRDTAGPHWRVAALTPVLAPP